METKAHGDGIDTLAEHLFDTVAGVTAMTFIDDAIGQCFVQADLFIDFPQKQRPGIGGQPTTEKIADKFAAIYA